MSTIVADTHPFVVGVDTHARTHTLAVLAASGRPVATGTFPTTPAGRRRAIAWAARRADHDPNLLWVIEGSATYGATLARDLATAGHQVVEAARANPRAARGTAKTDELDATRIAAAVLPLPTDRLRRPRADDGIRDALQTLLTARETMTSERTRAVNALTAILRTTDLGIDARRPLTARHITQAAGWRARTEPIATATARTEATRLAQRVTDLDRQLRTNQTTITGLIRQSPAAPLLATLGIGPVTAAIAFVTWSHPGRIRNEAAFAAIAGANPIPASSGNTTRHRLNPGGDRRLNRALNTIALVRMTHDPTTRAYVEKRRTQGKTDKEIRRCLKRYLARHIYRTLNNAASLDKT